MIKIRFYFLQIFIFITTVVPALKSFGQQIPDTSYKFSIYQPAYKPKEGPVVFIDEAHNNIHTRTGGFSPFSKLLEQDGYQIKSLTKLIADSMVLKECKILVIANPLHKFNVNNWVLPNRSAFTKEEIGLIKKWVGDGGSLFLIADHMPFAGAAYQLAKIFGFEFLNGFAKTDTAFWPPSVFKIQNGTLKKSPATDGLKEYEKIESVATFTGSAFRSPVNAINVINFLDSNISFQPDTAWKFNKNTPQKNLGGYHQGALFYYGNGRIAVFGEAAMFTAQIANGDKVGFNSKYAPHNAQFTLNVIHWLDNVREYKGIIKKKK